MPTPTVGQTVTFNADGETTPNPGRCSGLVAAVVSGHVLLMDVRDTDPVVRTDPVTGRIQVNTGTKPGWSQTMDVPVSAIVTAV